MLATLPAAKRKAYIKSKDPERSFGRDQKVLDKAFKEEFSIDKINLNPRATYASSGCTLSVCYADALQCHGANVVRQVVEKLITEKTDAKNTKGTKRP